METATKTGTLSVTVAPGSQSVTKTGTVSVLVGVNRQTATASGTVTVTAAPQQVVKTGVLSVGVGGAIVVAGPAFTVEAGDRFTLSAQTETPAPGTTIVGREWRLAGVLVGTTRTVAVSAPITRGGVTQTYTYAVTDSNGATSPPSSVNVRVRPATLRTGGGRPLVKRTGPGPTPPPA